jgi:hypothetical protein
VALVHCHTAFGTKCTDGVKAFKGGRICSLLSFPKLLKAFYEGRLQSSWSYLVNPSWNSVEVR